ncbi:MAG TPA: caspase family protein [Limnobacter sp.]|uniref:caspase family protein n=1 Tax=Limnobacter sp. TaxID=2003368 RepID=UPI002ED774B9
MPKGLRVNLPRRACLARLLACVGAGLAVPRFAAAAQGKSGRPVKAATGAQRYALLVGNGQYPSPYDLPPVPKNVMDLADALAFRGFDVTQALNLDESGLMSTVEAFVQRVAQAPPDSVTLFYYAGHGLQLAANNLLLGSGTNPAAPRRDLVARSLVLQQRLLSALPARPEALNITVIDACRTDLRAALGDSDGLNQVEAPVGSIVCFSTAAGKPAVSPASADQNTFYTAALVQALRTAPGELTFDALLRQVKQAVEQTMRTHPLAAIRRLAQSPFIADNARRKVALSVDDGPLLSVGSAPSDPPDVLQAWQALALASWPPEVIRLAEQFLRDYPGGWRAQQASLDLAGARQALSVLRSRDVRLFKTSFVAPDNGASVAQGDLQKAARGDKDAAMRMARLHQAEATDVGRLRYEGWLQYATGLGNGIASYALALHYRAMALPILAAQAEAQAIALGYSPPRALTQERK